MPEDEDAMITLGLVCASIWEINLVLISILSGPFLYHISAAMPLGDGHTHPLNKVNLVQIGQDIIRKLVILL